MSQKNVLYGEKEKLKLNSEGILRIYFDREGKLYPEHFIADAGLRASGASLKSWYRENPAEFKKIAGKYKLTDTNPGETSINALQDTLRKQYIARIEKESASFDDIMVLVHGFRKAFFEPNNGDYTSVKDYDTLRNSIGLAAKKKHYFIEIYWDAMYDRFSAKNVRNNKAILEMFEKEANINAVNTGYELRMILSGLKAPSLKMISHSLGARVITTALFNTDSSDKKYSTEEAFKTPGSKIDICLIAPAIGGTDVFSAYYQRHTAHDYRKKDNYRLLIVYNEKDFVLCKKDPKFLKLGPGALKYGNTTLGCNYEGEVEQVKSLFRDNYPGSEIRTLDFTAMGSHHHLRNYAGFSEFPELLRFLESDSN